jgi:26S proteasome regulatory subunit T5
MMARACAA